MGNDLERLGAHLDRYPNVMTEIGEYSRTEVVNLEEPEQFLIDYQDRVLFGKDAYNVKEYYTYFSRFRNRR